MIQSVNGNTVLNNLSGTFNTPITAKTVSQNADFDSYLKANNSLSAVPEPYSNQVEEPISREEYEKYCGVISDGITTIYFPPENASYAAKKAWIEGMKQLEAEGKGGEIATIKLGIVHNLKQQQGLAADVDLSTLKLASNASAGSCQDILMELLDEQKEMLSKGDYSGVDPEKFRKLQEGHIDALQTVLNSFKKYNVK